MTGVGVGNRQLSDSSLSDCVNHFTALRSWCRPLAAAHRHRARPPHRPVSTGALVLPQLRWRAPSVVARSARSVSRERSLLIAVSIAFRHLFHLRFAVRPGRCRGPRRCDGRPACVTFGVVCAFNRP